MLSDAATNPRPRGHGAVPGARSLGESDRVIVLAQLEKILRSRGFVSAPQLSRLLRFLVKESLAGRGDSLMQYRIGTEALGQPAGFDPEANAVVRVTCGRLRAKLKAYYETLGMQDTCWIALPRSGYQLVIVDSLHRAERVRRSPAAGEGAVVGVLEFKGLGLPEKWQYLPAFLSEELVMLISHAGPVRLRGPLSRKALLQEDLDATVLAEKYAVDYILDGSIEHRGGKLFVRARLLDGTSGIQLWCRKYEGASEHPDFDQIETEILQSIATELGADFGKIERHLIGLVSLLPAESLTVDEAILKAKAYELDYSEKSYRAGVAALEQAIVIAPANARGHASLSVLLFFGYLELFNVAESFPTRALELASRALQLEPLGPWSRFAQVTAAFVSGEREQFVALSAGLFADRGFPLGLLGGGGPAADLCAGGGGIQRGGHPAAAAPEPALPEGFASGVVPLSFRCGSPRGRAARTRPARHAWRSL